MPRRADLTISKRTVDGLIRRWRAQAGGRGLLGSRTGRLRVFASIRPGARSMSCRAAAREDRRHHRIAIPAWRCSVLYQGKNDRQKAMAAVMSSKRPLPSAGMASSPSSRRANRRLPSSTASAAEEGREPGGRSGWARGTAGARVHRCRSGGTVHGGACGGEL